MTTKHSPDHDDSNNDALKDDALLEVRAALRGLRFGNVNVIVQDGVIVQIDRTEKTRVRQPKTK